MINKIHKKSMLWKIVVSQLATPIISHLSIQMKNYLFVKSQQPYK